MNKLYLTFLALVSLISLPLSSQAQYCGPSADDDIVIMIQANSGMHAGVLDQEKQLARNLLSHFSSLPPGATRPRVAIGYYSSDGISPSAWIPDDGHLTDNYGGHLPFFRGLYAVIDDIRPGSAGVELAHVLKTAQVELLTYSPRRTGSVVLIGDGIITRGGTAYCNESDSLWIEAFGKADEMKAMGMRIFTVHINNDGPCPAGTGGARMLRMAARPFYALEFDTDQRELYEYHTSQVNCSDSDICTNDVCDARTNSCSFVSPDTDGDSVIDCADACPGGNDTLLGSPCSSGAGACFSNGSMVCSGANLVCSAVPGLPAAEACDGADNNCDGQTDEGEICIQTYCSTLDTSSIKKRLYAQAKSQHRKLRNSIMLIKDANARAKLLKRINALYKKLTSCSSSLPASVRSCQAASGCVSQSDLRAKSNLCKDISGDLAALGPQIAEALRGQYKQGGVCTGSVAECRERLNSWRRSRTDAVWSASYEYRLYKRHLANMPKSESVC